MRAGRLIGLILAVLISSSAVAYSQSDWWMREDEGWFFYNYYSEEEDKSKKAEAPAAPQTQAANDELYTDKMARIGKELMSVAIENPTEENVKAYMEHNKAMIVSSGNFSVAWQKMMMKYPHLLFEGGLKYAHTDIKDAISDLGRQAGLYFFHSSSCPACRQQAQALKNFEQAHGDSIAIFPITMDAPLPEYPDAVADNGMSATLGVDKVPSIYIAFPREGKIDLISSGFIDKFDLERRLLNYAKPIDKESVEALLNNSHGGIDNIADR